MKIKILEQSALVKSQNCVHFFTDTCTCSTPGAGTTGKNQMTCSNGETRHCDSDQVCYATKTFIYGKWSDGCKIPGNYSC